MTKPALIHLLRGAGLYHHRARRSVWFHGDGPGDFVARDELLRAVRAGAPAHRIVVTSSSPATCAWLARRYPDEFALPAPLALAPVFRRFLRQLRPEVLVLVGARDRVPRVASAARAAGLAVLDGGEPADVLAHLGPSTPASAGDRAARVASRGATLARARPGRALVALQRARRIADLAALSRRLGRPDTILCLGNGPTSEDPRALAVRHDALFRVNWRWIERQRLLDPQLVFVGDQRTAWRLRGAVLAFRDEALAREVLLARTLRLRFAAIETFAVASALPFVRDQAWPARPTNGALMVATAAALQPRRLVVAGVDLFAHPAGRYPANTLAENRYGAAHDRGVDVAIIRSALADYAGELTIVGDTLAAALAGEDDRAAATPRRDAAGGGAAVDATASRKSAGARQ